MAVKQGRGDSHTLFNQSQLWQKRVQVRLAILEHLVFARFEQLGVPSAALLNDMFIHANQDRRNWNVQKCRRGWLDFFQILNVQLGGVDVNELAAWNVKDIPRSKVHHDSQVFELRFAFVLVAKLVEGLTRNANIKQRPHRHNRARERTILREIEARRPW